MIKLNQLLLPVTFLAVIGILIVGGYIILNDEKSTNNKKADIFESDINQNNTMFYMKNTTGKLINQSITPNTNPVFNVGDRFVYEFTNVHPPNLIGDAAPFLTFFNDSIGCILEYNVINKIEIDKNTYFKIQENVPKCTVGVWNLKGVLKPVSRGGYVLYQVLFKHINDSNI